SRPVQGVGDFRGTTPDRVRKNRSAGRPVSRVLCRRLAPAVTAIYLAVRSPTRSSSLPGSRNGPDQPCSPIWPCSRWGLPSQPVTRLLVGSYIKGLASPRLFTLTAQVRRCTFCCTFPIRIQQPEGSDSDGGCYPSPRPVEPGLSSP